MYNRSDGSYMGYPYSNHDISFPISFNTTTLSILKNNTYIDYIDFWKTNVYRDNSGNNGWDNSKMIVTPDWNSNAWQSMLHFFLIIGF